jgi:Uncharacterized conserved protein (DUF2190)
MPAPLLGPNSTNPHGQPEVQSYISNDGVSTITPGSPVVFDQSAGAAKGVNVLLGANLSGGVLAGIALTTAVKGDYVSVAISGPVKAKTVSTPAVGAALQLDATGTGLTTKSTGSGAGYALEASVGNVATVMLRLS